MNNTFFCRLCFRNILKTYCCTIHLLYVDMYDTQHKQHFVTFLPNVNTVNAEGKKCLLRIIYFDLKAVMII